MWRTYKEAWRRGNSTLPPLAAFPHPLPAPPFPNPVLPWTSPIQFQLLCRFPQPCCPSPLFFCPAAFNSAFLPSLVSYSTQPCFTFIPSCYFLPLCSPFSLTSTPFPPQRWHQDLSSPFLSHSPVLPNLCMHSYSCPGDFWNELLQSALDEKCHQ